MKYPFHTPVPRFDVPGITRTIESALASAGLSTMDGPMREVCETIRTALSSSEIARKMPQVTNAIAAPDDVIDLPSGTVEDNAPGVFLARQFSNVAGRRAYKLYVPARPTSTQMPLVVMLHGCTQSADDFAAGTQMNRLADELGFLVVYPEQSSQANPSRCWNWFKAEDQARDAGEPSLIAGIVREVIAHHDVDPQRVFVAGLSAGAAMAIVLGETYPEMFAAVGAHSGLPYAVAQDIPSALSAMKGGRGAGHFARNVADVPGVKHQSHHAVPTIVFHGDRDHTVQQSNGMAIVQKASAAHEAQFGYALHTSAQRGQAQGGRRYTREVLADEAGRHRVESWTIHGAGHAWSGGDSSGSYTDRNGPDASREMMRFFLEQTRTAVA